MKIHDTFPVFESNNFFSLIAETTLSSSTSESNRLPPISLHVLTHTYRVAVWVAIFAALCPALFAISHLSALMRCRRARLAPQSQTWCTLRPQPQASHGARCQPRSWVCRRQPRQKTANPLLPTRHRRIPGRVALKERARECAWDACKGSRKGLRRRNWLCLGDQPSWQCFHKRASASFQKHLNIIMLL